MRTGAALVLLVAAAGCTKAPTASTPAGPSTALTKMLAGRTAGPPQDCIDTSVTGSAAIVDNRTIVYSATQRTLYVAHIDNCPALAPLNTLIVQRYGAQLCRRDRFQVLTPGSSIPSGVCFFDRFTPYTRDRG